MASRRVQVPSSSDSSPEDVRASRHKLRTWLRGMPRDKRRNRFKRKAVLMPSRFDICTKQKMRRVVRSVYLALACLIGSLLTLYLVQPRSSTFDKVFERLDNAGGQPLDVKSPEYPSNFFGSVMPIPCHSHNDQQRRTPLHAALGTGCISVEADIWPMQEVSSLKLLVGHDRVSLDPARSLRRIYLEPLREILEANNPGQLREDGAQTSVGGSRLANGVYKLSPDTSLTLLLDFKSPSPDMFTALQAALQPLLERDWLSYWDPVSHSKVERPVTVVASGLADFDMILRGGNVSLDAPTDVKRYIFFDAPLNDLVKPGDPDADPSDRALNIDLNKVPDRKRIGKGRKKPSNLADLRQVYDFFYNPSNSHFASTSLAKAIGPISPLLSHPDQFQRKIIRSQIRAARDRGLLSRYWGAPRWPRGLRDSVWETLQLEGVGLLSVDDLRGVRKGTWGSRAGGRWWDLQKESAAGWTTSSDE